MNGFKTALLFVVLTLLFVFVGYLIGGRSGVTFAFIIAVVMNFVSYWFSDKIVLAIYRAKPITESDNPRLYRIVRSVSQMAGIPMPKVYIIPNDSANAFATGRNPNHAAVAATGGILDILDDNELAAVMAHELGHVKNRDTLVSAVAATIAGAISYIAFMARWMPFLGGGFGGRPEEHGPRIRREGRAAEGDFRMRRYLLDTCAMGDLVNMIWLRPPRGEVGSDLRGDWNRKGVMESKTAIFDQCARCRFLL